MDQIDFENDVSLNGKVAYRWNLLTFNEVKLAKNLCLKQNLMNLTIKLKKYTFLMYACLVLEACK